MEGGGALVQVWLLQLSLGIMAWQSICFYVAAAAAATATLRRHRTFYKTGPFLALCIRPFGTQT